MPAKDFSKVVLRGISQKDRKQLDDKLSNLHALKDSVTNEKDIQSLDEVIDLTTKAHTYNKNVGFSNDLYTVAAKLKDSSNIALQSKGTTLLQQLNTQQQAIMDWKDVNKKNAALNIKINKTHRNILMNVVLWENAVVQDIISRNDSKVAQEAANAMSTSLAKAESKSHNVQFAKATKKAKEDFTTAKRKLEEHRASGKSDKESKLVEMKLQQDADMKYSRTKAASDKKVYSRQNEAAALAKKRHEDFKANPTGKTDKENEQIEEQLKQDADMKESKTRSGRYQQKNAICGFTKENLVSTAIDLLRHGRFYVPLSATKRSKERCARFTEAFRSRDRKKLLSLYSNK